MVMSFVSLIRRDKIVNRPLLDAYENLAENIPLTPLLNGVTPVEKFNAAGTSIPGLDGLWVKRDDKTNTVYGGNKVRKLEFTLPEAMAKAQRDTRARVVTLGAIGTNHGVATSIFCRQHNVDCRIYLFDQPVTDTVKANLKLMAAHSAQLEYRGSLIAAALAYYRAQTFDRHSYFLPPGGSNIAGCIGFVNAAFELKQQIDSGELPEPDQIICAVGSSGTLAGLTLGCQLVGLKSHVRGIRVAPARVGGIPVCTNGTVARLQRQTYRYLRNKSRAVPEVQLQSIALEQGYYGAGYGHSTDAGHAAMGRFKDAGIELESTYTAKAAAATLAHCRQNPLEKVLYWHTFNSVACNTELELAQIEAIPLTLRRRLEL